MFLNTVICEFLDVSGQLDTLIFTPQAHKSTLGMMADKLANIAQDFRRSPGFDMGPFRIYAEGERFDVRQLRTRLGGVSFCRSDNGELEVAIEHMGIPIGLVEEGRKGEYALILPRKHSIIDLHVLDPYKFGKEFRKTVIWDVDQARHVVQVELRSRRHRSFSFRLHCTLVASEQDLFRKTDRRARNAIGEPSWGKWRSYVDALGFSEGQAPGVFLCHSSTDKEFCRRLANDLMFEGFRVWIDEAEIKVGDSLIEKIESGIDEMGYLVAVLSARSISSRWCQEELRQALVSQISGAKVRVLPLLLEDCQMPGFLREKRYADFRSWENSQEAYSIGFEQLTQSIRSRD